MAKKRATPKNTPRTKRPDGRGHPPTYNPDIYPKATKALCAKGETAAEFALAFDLAISTIWQWKISHPSFRVV